MISTRLLFEENRIKNHMKKHWKKYALGALAGSIGATGANMLLNKAEKVGWGKRAVGAVAGADLALHASEAAVAGGLGAMWLKEKFNKNKKKKV